MSLLYCATESYMPSSRDEERLYETDWYLEARNSLQSNIQKWGPAPVFAQVTRPRQGCHIHRSKYVANQQCIPRNI